MQFFFKMTSPTLKAAGTAPARAGIAPITLTASTALLYQRPSRIFGLILTNILTRISSSKFDVWQNSSAVQAAYGIICGYSDVNNFYALTIVGGGYVEIFRYQQGKRLTLYSAEDQAGIDPKHNYLEVMCAANQLSLWVNGNIVAEVEVTEFTHGDVGLIVSSFDEVSIEIDFDNFVVKSAGFSIEP